MESIEAISADRERLHAGHASSRPLSVGYERVGLKGEAEFALRYGLKFDATARPGGDAGTDFRVPIMMRLDVKTARKPIHLIVEVGKVVAEIYVLAGIDENDHVTFYGWEMKSAILAAPTKDFGYGVINHFIHRDKLRPMRSLESRIGGIK